MTARAPNTDMPYRVLGHTGERVSAIGLGGWHLSFPRLDEQAAVRIVRTAIDRGINFMGCLLYTSPSPRDGLLSRMPSSA